MVLVRNFNTYGFSECMWTDNAQLSFCSCWHPNLFGHPNLSGPNLLIKQKENLLYIFLICVLYMIFASEFVCNYCNSLQYICSQRWELRHMEFICFVPMINRVDRAVIMVELDNFMLTSVVLWRRLDLNNFFLILRSMLNHKYFLLRVAFLTTKD